MHEVRLPGASKPELHEERMKSHTTGDNTEANNSVKPEATETVKSPASYTYTYGTEDEEPGRDEGNEDPEEETPLQADTLEEYFTKRVFIFVHHYAGVEDPLTTAMRNEALAQGIRLKAYSIEKAKGTGDLLDDEPYTTHLRWARRGYIDAYHAGFPCSTFSRLRLRKARNIDMPGPDLLGRLQSPMAGRTTHLQSKPNATEAPSWLVVPLTWQRQCAKSRK